jgi:hypothetical protein
MQLDSNNRLHSERVESKEYRAGNLRRSTELSARWLQQAKRPPILPVVKLLTAESVLHLIAAKNLAFSFPLTLRGRADKVID